VTDYGTVDLAVQDTDLAQVLEMLSIQGRKNIITSRNVSATVSANLYDVTFYEALDAILTVNGYGYVEEGNFIYVMTQEELSEMQAATRQTESRIFELQYLSASDASEFIGPLLSDVGRAAARGDVQAGYDASISDGGADSYAYTAKIVVNDYAENLESIANLLAELDTPPDQVLLEATILQTTLDETNAYGVDFSVIADMNFLDLTNPLSPINNLLGGSDATTGFQPPDNQASGLQSTVGNTAGAGGFKLGIIRDDISVFLKLLDEVTDLTVIARPKIMVLNRQRAEILVGARVGYLSTTATQTTTTQTVQFLDTGVKLVFRPFVSKNGMIRLELSPSVSEASLRTVTDAQGLQVTIPDELTNELTTNVRIRDGQTLVLGGLFKESTKTTKRQVPFLGDIPILNLAFTGQDDTVDRDEIIFLITPSIVHDEVLWEMGAEGLGYTDAVRVGARRGLLPFSREQMTSGYNTKALDAFRDGDLKRALHWANTSLNLSKDQAAMIMLREDITGKRERVFDGSIMERAIRASLGPLPRESVEMPREVAGLGGSRRAPLNWAPRAMPMPPAEPTPAPMQPDWPTMTPDQPEWPQQPVEPTGTDGGHTDAGTQTDTNPGPVSAAPGRGATKDVPQISANPKFWMADHPAGFDDPAWRQTVPFSTFDDVMDSNDS
jgi:type IV pilus assembly protein PilQ